MPNANKLLLRCPQNTIDPNVPQLNKTIFFRDKGHRAMVHNDQLYLANLQLFFSFPQLNKHALFV